MLADVQKNDMAHVRRGLICTHVLPQGIVDLKPGDQVVVIKRRVIPAGMKLPYDDQRLIVKAIVLGGGPTRPPSAGYTAYSGKSIIYHRSTKIGLDTIMDDNKFKYTVSVLGPDFDCLMVMTT